MIVSAMKRKHHTLRCWLGRKRNLAVGIISSSPVHVCRTCWQWAYNYHKCPGEIWCTCGKVRVVQTSVWKAKDTEFVGLV